MSSTKAKRHVHKYYRVTISYAKTWACGLPDCNHYMPKNMEAMINGKQTLCWQCGEVTLMTPMSMKEDQPRCDECRTGIVIEEDTIPFSGILRKKDDEAIPETDAQRRIAEFLKR